MRVRTHGRCHQGGHGARALLPNHHLEKTALTPTIIAIPAPICCASDLKIDRNPAPDMVPKGARSPPELGNRATWPRVQPKLRGTYARDGRPHGAAVRLPDARADGRGGGGGG